MSSRMSSFRSSPIDRRRFMRGAGAGLIGLTAAPALLSGAFAQGRRWSGGDPFSLGVASGAPRPDGFVLWTRLAPDPLSPDPATPGGMTGGDVPVTYEIAGDPAMRDIVRRGTATAERSFGYSVHADVRGLPPGRSYCYRFVSGDAASPAPHDDDGYSRHAAGAHAVRLRLLLPIRARLLRSLPPSRGRESRRRDVSRRLHLLICRAGPPHRAHPFGRHRSRDAADLSQPLCAVPVDPDLQRLHAAAPALVTWDDHEVQNDYAGKYSQYFEELELFLQRRAAAYRAFYEHMPVRPILSQPNGPVMRVYDRFRFGDLLEVSMIDGRQYRSREACYGPPSKGGGHLETDAACPERREEGRTMIGFAQEAWLGAGLARSKAQWNLIAQDVLMAQLRQKNQSGNFGFWTDDWDGYPAGRRRLLARIAQTKVSNPVVIGGDIHAFFANDLRVDFDDPNSQFVGTSVSSAGPPYDLLAATLPDNPHVRFFESRKRGYVSIDVDAKLMTTRMRALSDVTDPQVGVSTLKTFAVESGRPGVAEA
jgi:alkaline phosphatase D